MTTKRSGRACAGDASALAGLFDRYHTRVYRYALARLGDRFLAEDVAAEVFVEVAQRLPRFRGQAVEFAAWLFTIARHDIADLRRSGWSRRVQPTTDLPDRPAPDDPASAAILRLDVARLKAALDRLTDDQRDVVMLRYAAGLGNDEAAREVLRALVDSLPPPAGRRSSSGSPSRSAPRPALLSRRVFQSRLGGPAVCRSPPTRTISTPPIGPRSTTAAGLGSLPETVPGQGHLPTPHPTCPRSSPTRPPPGSIHLSPRAASLRTNADITAGARNARLVSHRPAV